MAIRVVLGEDSFIAREGILRALEGIEGPAHETRRLADADLNRW